MENNSGMASYVCYVLCAVPMLKGICNMPFVYSSNISMT